MSVPAQRLAAVFDTHLAAVTMLPANQQRWRDGHVPDPANPGTFFLRTVAVGGFGNFGRRMANLMSIIVHETDGWPPRNRAPAFVHKYITPDLVHHDEHDGNVWGIGPQFYISYDGSAYQLIGNAPFGDPLMTFHTPFSNQRAIGVETGHGNGFSENIAPDHQVAVGARQRWTPASGNNHVNDIPNAQLFFTEHHDDALNENDNNLFELIPGWWATAQWDGPMRVALPDPIMLFSESQYRSWALLGRALTVEYKLPRNFPLLPHTQRPAAGAAFRRIALADESADMQARHLHAARGYAANALDPAQIAAHYNGNSWDDMFDLYRGFHGHWYVSQNHDCPGPIFDWWRLARSIWDWWWFPFDFEANPSVNLRLEHREYRPRQSGGGRVVPNADTPTLDHYWDNDPNPPALANVAVDPELRYRGRRADGVLGPTSSPQSFDLAANVPVYAMANGTLVAAWFPRQELEQVSFGFALIRHEVYNVPVRLDVHDVADVFNALGANLPAFVEQPDINYDAPPTQVFSLYMHLSPPNGISFGAVTDNNPDWLNRLIIRLKECELGIDFQTHNRLLDRGNAHVPVSNTAWNSHGPGNPQRPTIAAAWAIDNVNLRAFLNSLQAGDVAALMQADNSTPIRIVLGDYLGDAGNMRHVGGVAHPGVRVEVFSPWLIPTTAFSLGFTANWTVPAGLAPPSVLFYQSEWARALTAAEKAALGQLNADPDLMSRWWRQVALATLLDQLAPPGSVLPVDGWLYHYPPLEFLHWLNGVTWASEWPKYQITDDAQGRFGRGNPVPKPNRPRSRLV